MTRKQELGRKHRQTIERLTARKEEAAKRETPKCKVWVKQKQQRPQVRPQVKPQVKKENSCIQKLKKEIEPSSDENENGNRSRKDTYESTILDGTINDSPVNSLVDSQNNQSPQDQLANLFNFSSRKNMVREEEIILEYDDTQTEGSDGESSIEDEATYEGSEVQAPPPVRNVQYKHIPDAALLVFRDSKEAYYQEFGEPNVIKMHKTVPNVSMKFGVVIKVEASTVSISDCEIRRNMTSSFLDVITLPQAPGQDLVGRIVHAGEKVKRSFRKGDRICSIHQFLGGNARYVTIPADHLVRVPETVDAADAVCLVRSYLAAYQILHRTGAFEISNDHRILVTGANGAIGRAVIDLAKLARAKVYGACSSRHKKFIQQRLGVSWVHSNPQNWTRLEDIDVVIDCVNYTGNFNDSKAPLKSRGGVLVCVGSAKYVSDTIREQKSKIEEIAYNTSEDSEIHVGENMCGAFTTTSSVVTKQSVYKSDMLSHLPLKCSGGPHFSLFVTQVSFDLFKNLEKNWKQCQDDLEYLFAMLLAGKIKPMIASRISLQQVVKAHKILESGGLHGTIVCLPFKSVAP